MKSTLQKYILSIAVVLLATVSVYAQVPQGFNFQAVARDANGDILADKNLGVQVSLLNGAESENPVYTETHNVTTNPLGLIQIVIGEGTAAEGQSFSAINFSSGNFYVKLGIDLEGGANYSDLGSTRLLSVPYALVAQKAVEGSGEGATMYNLNTANGDTSFIVKAIGTTGLTSIRGIAETDGKNVGVEGIANSEASNSNNMYGMYGSAPGLGSGTQIGMLGSSVNGEAGEASSRRGVMGQARSKSKYNYGMYGLGLGDGNGDEGEGYGVGSINFGGYGFASGNIWNNTGLEGNAGGNVGKVNFGISGLAGAGATDSTKNYGLAGRAFGPGINYGVYGTAWDGVENYAGLFDGEVVINGDLTINGNIKGTGDSGNSNGQTLDSLFVSTSPEAEYQRNTSFYPGFIKNTDQDGNFANLSRVALQYGNEGSGGIFNWFSKSTMQVAHQDYANGERASGLNPGYFYMDIYKDGNFYVPVELGVQNATDGGRPYFSMSSLAMKEAGKGNLFSINIANDPNGSDPNGETAEMFLWGDESPNFQIGGQPWNNGDLGFFVMYGSTPDGNGWYYNNANLSVGSDGTDEWGSMTFSKTNIAGQANQQTILLDGKNGNIDIAGALNQSSDVRLKKDIHTIENALENTLKMRGVSYNWKTDESNQNPQIGVIAQEVEKIYPEFVHTNNDGMKSVNYAQMTAVLIEAVKTLNAELQKLKTSNTMLQAKIDKQSSLENRLSEIEKLLKQQSIPANPSNVSAEK